MGEDELGGDANALADIPEGRYQVSGVRDRGHRSARSENESRASFEGAVFETLSAVGLAIKDLGLHQDINDREIEAGALLVEGDDETSEGDEVLRLDLADDFPRAADQLVLFRRVDQFLHLRAVALDCLELFSVDLVEVQHHLR